MQLSRTLFLGFFFGFAGLSQIAASSGSQAPVDRFEFRLPHRAAYRLETNALQTLTAGQRPQWLKAHLEGSTNAVEFGSRFVVQLKSGTSTVTSPATQSAALARLLAASSNPRPALARTVSSNLFILQASDALTAAQEAHRLAALPEVEAAYPVLRRPAQLHGPYYPRPTDYYYSMQWPLEQRNGDGSQAGVDLNVRAAWPYTLGEGVTIAVADIGIEMTHPELASHLIQGPHYNFADSTTNAGPINRSGTAAHATEVAGILAASMNDFRMTGIAPGANLASWVIFDTNYSVVTDEQLMDMYQYQSNVVSVQNHSWGPVGPGQNAITPLEQIGIQHAVTKGRFGRGVVLVRSAGNDRESQADANDNGYAADPRSIAVAAARADGRVASYSDPGACILVGAPSGDLNAGFPGVFTTDLLGSAGVNQVGYCPPWQPDCANKDLNGYVFNTYAFTGTSAAAPHVAGVAALMLSANPSLSYRDVQQILILSSRHLDWADPDLATNGAGFVVSHNLGFGVPDAGVAVELARRWNSRPSPIEVTWTTLKEAAIPDAGLRLLVTGDSVPPELASLECWPSTGPHADTPTASLPLVDFGYGTNLAGYNLTNKAALIQRGNNTFASKINLAAQGGAALAVVYNFDTNNPGGGDALSAMAATDFVPIPAVFIGHTAGDALRTLCQTNQNVLAQIKLFSTSYVFNVSETLSCEHVGLRVLTDHPLRSQLRITLVSPMGTRSVLQHFNNDAAPGPVDWTYYSTHHFFESSAGTWTAYISDEASGSTGTVQQVSLILNGVPIRDEDRDGLDDYWELNHFKDIYAQGPKDDGDKDGYSNAREQIMGTDPTVAENLGEAFKADLSWWTSSSARLSWPASPYWNYEVWSGTNAAALSLVTNLPGKWPVTEWFGPWGTTGMQFYRVRATAKP